MVIVHYLSWLGSDAARFSTRAALGDSAMVTAELLPKILDYGAGCFGAVGWNWHETELRLETILDHKVSDDVQCYRVVFLIEEAL